MLVTLPVLTFGYNCVLKAFSDYMACETIRTFLRFFNVF